MGDTRVIIGDGCLGKIHERGLTDQGIGLGPGHTLCHMQPGGEAHKVIAKGVPAVMPATGQLGRGHGAHEVARIDKQGVAAGTGQALVVKIVGPEHGSHFHESVLAVGHKGTVHAGDILPGIGQKHGFDLAAGQSFGRQAHPRRIRRRIRGAVHGDTLVSQLLFEQVGHAHAEGVRHRVEGADAADAKVVHETGHGVHLILGAGKEPPCRPAFIAGIKFSHKGKEHSLAGQTGIFGLIVNFFLQRTADNGVLRRQLGKFLLPVA